MTDEAFKTAGRAVSPEINATAQHGMEQSGLLPISKYDMKTLQGEMVKRNTWDRFDGTDYSYEVFEEKKDGQMKVFRLY